MVAPCIFITRSESGVYENIISCKQLFLGKKKNLWSICQKSSGNWHENSFRSFLYTNSAGGSLKCSEILAS